MKRDKWERQVQLNTGYGGREVFGDGRAVGVSKRYEGSEYIVNPSHSMSTLSGGGRRNKTGCGRAPFMFILGHSSWYLRML